ncbi:MAG: DUF2769 domain-containing protein [Planctomycetes bacterium]|nr:DUF2769 domain-containing protein [Planctomycetota bacterium]
MSLRERVETAVKQKSKIVPFNDQTKELCQCADCPTHEQCEKAEIVFCSAGDSDNNDSMAQKGCQCGTCEVFQQHSLAGGYYCMEGEA